MVYLHSLLFHDAKEILKMTKTRKIGVGDYVKFGRHEWIVSKQTKDKMNLVRRGVLTSPPIWVPKSKVKLANQAWRKELKRSDTVLFFCTGMWTPSTVTSRYGSYLMVQPCFTNYVEQVHEDSSAIIHYEHTFPMWSVENVREVLYMGQIRTERGNGLLFPWEYGEGTPLAKQKHEFIKTLKFKLSEITQGHYPFKFYDRLSTEEIVYDLSCFSKGQNPLLHKVVTQHVTTREVLYPIFPDNTLQLYIELALQHDDHRRVNELLSVGQHEELFQRNEWAVQERTSLPFFELKFRTGKHHLYVDLFWCKRRIKKKLPDVVSKILFEISVPLDYSPKIFAVEESPENAYVLSRMLGMELEPLDNIFLRKISSSGSRHMWLTVHGGFCRPSYEHFGGVVNAFGCDYIKLVRLLQDRSCEPTLVVVHPDCIDEWDRRGDGEFGLWHGKRREISRYTVVTTRNTFVRSWTHLVGFKRLVCVCLPTAGSVYDHALSSISCKTRWAFVMESTQDNLNRAFKVVGCPPDPKAVIALDRPSMENMGVIFPLISHKVVHCAPYNYRHVLENLKFESEIKKLECVSKYLIYTGLVPKYLAGVRLDTCEATMDSICKNFELKRENLESQLKDRCAICMEPLSEAMVTPCGHVFCPGCTNNLRKRKLHCPMCRATIDGYVKLSDKTTKGSIHMHRGDCYRVTETEKWGSKVRYIQSRDAPTVVTKYAMVKNTLRKKCPNAEVMTTQSIRHGRKPSSEDVIFLEPMDAGFERYLQCAWGKNVNITSLTYKIKLI